MNGVRQNVTPGLRASMLPVIAWPMSVVLQGVVKGVYRPLHRTRLFKALPSREYLYSLSSFSFRRNYNIVFDHLVAPVAFYLSRAEFEPGSSTACSATCRSAGGTRTHGEVLAGALWLGLDTLRH